MTARRPRRGGAAMELALVTPLLLALLAGVVQLAFLISASERVAFAAHEAARAGAAVPEGPSPTGDELVAITEAEARAALVASGLACDAGCDVHAAWSVDGPSGLPVLRVTLAVPYDPPYGAGASTVLRGEAVEVTLQR